nr:hypothetical protein [Tanacetum cinerariifolium]
MAIPLPPPVTQPQIVVNNVNNPLYIVNSDHPGMVLTNTSFNGTNFHGWSRNFKMALETKLKLRFIDGFCNRPSVDSVDEQRWIRCDYMNLNGLPTYDPPDPNVSTQIPSATISNDNGPTQLKRSTRQPAKPSWLKDFVTPHRANAVSSVQYPLFSAYDFKGIPYSHIAFLANAFAATDPTNFHQAKTDDGWIEAMNKELAAKLMKTWTLTSLPSSHTLISSKWVYKTKFKPDGSEERKKARLVVRGFNQKE